MLLEAVKDDVEKAFCQTGRIRRLNLTRRHVDGLVDTQSQGHHRRCCDIITMTRKTTGFLSGKMQKKTSLQGRPSWHFLADANLSEEPTGQGDMTGFCQKRKSFLKQRSMAKMDQPKNSHASLFSP